MTLPASIPIEFFLVYLTELELAQSHLSSVHTYGIILSGVWDARFDIVIGMNESSRLKTKAFIHQPDMDSY